MEIRLFGLLRESHGKVVHLDWHEGVDGYAVMETLGISPKIAAIYVVNNKIADPAAALSENDIVSLLPAADGG